LSIGRQRDFQIQWSIGPDTPFGFQDSAFARLGPYLISVAGFSDQAVDQNTGVHLNTAFVLDTRSPDASWQTISPPSTVGFRARQGMGHAVVGDSLYMIGGFSYSDRSFREVSRIRHDGSNWIWEILPVQLPEALASPAAVAIGRKIYVVGGSRYNASATVQTYGANASGNPIGAQLLVLDVDQLQQGFQELSPLPGSPRYVHAAAVVNGRIYVFGGATGNDNRPALASGPATCTVLDNWVFDPATNRWSPLPETPVALGNFPTGDIVYQNRYIILIGGYDYGLYSNSRDPACRGPTDLPKGYSVWPENGFYSQILVFDTVTQAFSYSTPLPITNNVPMAWLEGDELHLIGGEATRTVLDGREFGHRPKLHLKGRFVPLRGRLDHEPGVAVYEPVPETLLGAKTTQVQGICWGSGPVFAQAISPAGETVSLPCTEGRFQGTVQLPNSTNAGQAVQIRFEQAQPGGRVRHHLLRVWYDPQGTRQSITIDQPAPGAQIHGPTLRVTGSCRPDLVLWRRPAFGIQTRFFPVDCINGRYDTTVDVSWLQLGTASVRFDQFTKDGTRLSSGAGGAGHSISKTSMAALRNCSFRGESIAHGQVRSIYPSASAPACTLVPTTCQDGTLSQGEGFASCTVRAPIPTTITQPLANATVQSPVRVAGVCDPARGPVLVVVASNSTWANCVGGAYQADVATSSRNNQGVAVRAQQAPSYEQQIPVFISN
jgi:hypothetical protein